MARISNTSAQRFHGCFMPIPSRSASSTLLTPGHMERWNDSANGFYADPNSLLPGATRCARQKKPLPRISCKKETAIFLEQNSCSALDDPKVKSFSVPQHGRLISSSSVPALPKAWDLHSGRNPLDMWHVLYSITPPALCF